MTTVIGPFIGDGGELIELHDVVGGAGAHLVESLIELHHEVFHHHAYAADQIRRDAMLPAVRDGITVHQWLMLVDGVPTGYALIDTNIVRGVAPVHYLAVRADSRTVTVGGERVATWLVRTVAQWSIDEGGPTMLAACGETPESTVDIFLSTGWRRFDIDYLEPVHGWQWPQLGTDTRAVALVWLPIGAHPALAGASDPGAVAALGRAAAAAFLIDTYRLPTDHAVVIGLTGDQHRVTGPRRDVVAAPR